MKIFIRALILLTTLIFFTGCGDDDDENPPPPPATTAEAPAPENWGGSGVQMQLSPDSVRIQLSCSHVEINQGLNPDANGRFDVTGFLVSDTGTNSRVATRVTGIMTGDTMTITVIPSGQTTTTFHLTRGQLGVLDRCVIVTPPPPPPPVSHEAKVGEWGGEHIEMNVTNTGATYQLDCGHGTIDQKISPDQTGKFHNTGTFTREGGPTPNPPPAGVPAVYDGTINNNNMALTITTTIDGNIDVSNFSLVFDRDGHLVRCQ